MPTWTHSPNNGAPMANANITHRKDKTGAAIDRGGGDDVPPTPVQKPTVTGPEPPDT